jgi:non-heme chloroperoxidase
MRTQRTQYRFQVLEFKLNKPMLLLLATIVLIAPAISFAATNDKNPPGTKSGFITTNDGIKIHYLEAGKAKIVGTGQESATPPADAVVTRGSVSLEKQRKVPAILFVPGWTMPAWIWQKQIDYFSSDYRVVAMDPRSQGESSQTSDGLYPAARARDIEAVIEKLQLAPVVVVGWSMGVTEISAYLAQFGSQDIAAIVLVDGYAGGLHPGEAESTLQLLNSILVDRHKALTEFMNNVMFKKPQPAEYIARLVKASDITPTDAAVALLVGMYGTDYKAALLKNTKPVLICAADGSIFASQLADLHKQLPAARYEIFTGAGHTLFVDDPDKFNGLLEDFLVDLR